MCSPKLLQPALTTHSELHLNIPLDADTAVGRSAFVNTSKMKTSQALLTHRLPHWVASCNSFGSSSCAKSFSSDAYNVEAYCFLSSVFLRTGYPKISLFSLCRSVQMPASDIEMMRQPFLQPLNVASQCDALHVPCVQSNSLFAFVSSCSLA